MRPDSSGLLLFESPYTSPMTAVVSVPDMFLSRIASFHSKIDS